MSDASVQAALFEMACEDPLPPNPVAHAVTLNIVLRLDCDLGAFVRAEAETLQSEGFLARIAADGHEPWEGIDILLHDRIEEVLDGGLGLMARYAQESIEWDSDANIGKATAERAFDALTLRYPKRFVGDA
jgi:hypothetical protein